MMPSFLAILTFRVFFFTNVHTSLAKELNHYIANFHLRVTAENFERTIMWVRKDTSFHEN